jgi:hypothetical protein
VVPVPFGSALEGVIAEPGRMIDAMVAAKAEGFVVGMCQRRPCCEGLADRCRVVLGGLDHLSDLALAGQLATVSAIIPGTALSSANFSCLCAARHLSIENDMSS